MSYWPFVRYNRLAKVDFQRRVEVAHRGELGNRQRQDETEASEQQQQVATHASNAVGPKVEEPQKKETSEADRQQPCEDQERASIQVKSSRVKANQNKLNKKMKQRSGQHLKVFEIAAMEVRSHERTTPAHPQASAGHWGVQGPAA